MDITKNSCQCCGKCWNHLLPGDTSSTTTSKRVKHVKECLEKSGFSINAVKRASNRQASAHERNAKRQRSNEIQRKSMIIHRDTLSSDDDFYEIQKTTVLHDEILLADQARRGDPEVQLALAISASLNPEAAVELAHTSSRTTKIWKQVDLVPGTTRVLPVQEAWR